MKVKEIQNMAFKDQLLSEYATLNANAIKLMPEDEDIRLPFFRDVDKIIYSLSYVRYIDKTQVFSNLNNDHISKRMIHVQLVSKIARTIGRALSLNEDLIEAASLGHDLGHVPFGHVGERILSKISEENNEGFFNHNIQSIRNLLYVENHGKGMNISLQVLDAIMCHNGEFVNSIYEPISKTTEDFFKEYHDAYIVKNITKEFVPMTLEGCVVRICDVVGYVGRDLEDAIRLDVIKKSDIPSDIVAILGDDNKKIVNTIVNDIIENSIEKPYIKMSKKIYDALIKLKNFNYENIYLKANTDDEIKQFKKMFNALFKQYFKDIESKNSNSSIFNIFLNDMDDNYIKNNSSSRIVLDYISGMTDEFFIKEYNKISKEL